MKQSIDSTIIKSNKDSTYIIGIIGCAKYELFHLKTINFETEKVEYVQLFENDFDFLVKSLQFDIPEIKESLKLSFQRDPFLIKNKQYKSFKTIVSSKNVDFDHLDSNFKIQLHRTAMERRLRQLHENERKIIEIKMSTSQKVEFKILIELFQKELPLLSNRFIELCSGANKNLSYKNTYIKHVQKGMYAQFGELEDEKSLNFIEDEKYTYKNDRPGLIGFVKSENRKHSNRCQFYVLLDALSIFDSKQVVFGKVIEGFSVFLNNIDNDIEILDTTVLEQIESEEKMSIISKIKAQKLPFERILTINSEKSMEKALKVQNQGYFYGGPKVLKLSKFEDRFKSSDFIKLNLHDVEEIIFDEFEFSKNFVDLCFGIVDLFGKLKSIQFLRCFLDFDFLEKILKDKKLTKLVFQKIPKNEKNPLFFESLFKLTSNFAGIQFLTIEGCDIHPESFNFLEEGQNLFDSKLEELNLSNNMLLDEGLDYLLSKMYCPKLQKVNISGTLITSESLLKIPNVKNLIELDISHNYDVKAFLQSFSENRSICQLKVLKASNCYVCPVVLASLIGNLKFVHLKEVYVNQNYGIFVHLMQALQNKTLPCNLKVLSMQNCGVCTNDLVELKHLNDFVSLNIFDLSFNDDIQFDELIKKQVFEGAHFWSSIGSVNFKNSSLTKLNFDVLVNDFGINVQE